MTNISREELETLQKAIIGLHGVLAFFATRDDVSEADAVASLAHYMFAYSAMYDDGQGATFRECATQARNIIVAAKTAKERLDALL